MGSNSSKKVLVVFGATGKQGGSVVKTILADPKTAAQFHVKAVTRDVSKDSAKELQALGAETIAANLDDENSLRQAIKGAYAVFAVTNFWEKFSAELEVKQGKTVADISKAEGVQHLIWSSLLDVTKLSNGALPNVHHFDSKAHVEDYIRSIDLPATYFLPGFFMVNIPGAGLRQLPDSTKYGFALPIPNDSPIPLFATERDTGKFVKGILLNREKTLGKRIYGATDYYTPDQIVDDFKAAFPEAGQDAKFSRLPDAVFKGIIAQRGAPEVVQQEMLENMRLMPEFGYYGGDSLKFSHSILDEPLTTWKTYVSEAPAFAELK